MQRSSREEAFLNAVCREVRWKRAHETIRRDLADHMEDQREAFVGEGMDPAEAARRAVAEMGDPAEVGLRMDESYRPDRAWTVAVPLLALLLLGAALQLILYGDLAHYEAFAGESVAKLGLSLGVGGLLATIAYNLNLYRLYRLGWAGYGVILISLVWRSTRAAAGLGYLGDANWPYLSLFAPVFLAGVLYSLRGRGAWRTVLSNLLCALPFLYVLLWSGRYFTRLLPCLLASLAVLALFLCSGSLSGKGGRILLLSLLAWGGALLLLTINWNKMTVNPFRYRQLCYAMESTFAGEPPYTEPAIRDILANARLFGRGGLTPAARSAFFQSGLTGVPVSGLEWCFFSDYCVTYLIYRFGWAAGMAAVTALLAAVGFGYARCLRLTSRLGRLLCVAILSVFAVQILLYLLGCFGYARLGVPFPLPFLCVGYRGQIVNMTLMGALLGLFRTDGLYVDGPARTRPGSVA